MPSELLGLHAYTPGIAVSQSFTATRVITDLACHPTCRAIAADPGMAAGWTQLALLCYDEGTPERARQVLRIGSAACQDAQMLRAWAHMEKRCGQTRAHTCARATPAEM